MLMETHRLLKRSVLPEIRLCDVMRQTWIVPSYSSVYTSLQGIPWAISLGCVGDTSSCEHSAT